MAKQQHTPEEKAKLALEAIRGEFLGKSCLARELQEHPNFHCPISSHRPTWRTTWNTAQKFMGSNPNKNMSSRTITECVLQNWMK